VFQSAASLTFILACFCPVHQTRRAYYSTRTLLTDSRCDENQHPPITAQQYKNIIKIMAELDIASKSDHTMQTVETDLENSSEAAISMATPQQPPNAPSVEPPKEGGEVVK
jgi:hypothetical protein